jgi:enoyl-CoA hydratase/carnithine racemase
MNSLLVTRDRGIATVTLSRGKVNALNEPFVEELNGCFNKLRSDPEVKAIILTGQGKFFSFGFDIPEFLSYSKEAFIRYLVKFTSFYTDLFLFEKPVVAALNGHTIAGGCMIATACDCRLMVAGKARISLNEITFGSSVFAGSVEIMKYQVGAKAAEPILYSGAMYSAEEAKRVGLIDQLCSEESLMEEAVKVALDLGGKDGSAFRGIKHLLRRPVADEFVKREKESIREFVDIWYSESTWRNLQEIKIHG